MKSVGEVMAIGRTFKAAMWKGIRSLETGKAFGSEKYDKSLIANKLITPTPDRLNYIRFALANGYSVADIHEMTSIDPWFLEQMKEVVDLEGELAKTTLATATTRAVPHRQAVRHQRFATGQDVGRGRNRSAQPAQGTRRQGRLQPRGHLRRGVRKLHAVPLFELRKRLRGRSRHGQEGHDSGQRTQSHRAGNRVRLLLLPRQFLAAGNGRRIDHGQLQSRDRVHRLRHQRPPLLRAAHAGERAQHRRYRKARWRDRAVRRADAAQSRAAAEAPRRAHHRHRSRGYRSRRRSQAVRQAARRAEDSVPRQRHRHQRGGSLRGRRAHRLSRCWCAPATCWAGAPW